MRLISNATGLHGTGEQTITDLDAERLKKVIIACDELRALYDRFGEVASADRFLRHALMRLTELLVGNARHLSEEFKTNFADLPIKEISHSYVASARNLQKDLSPIMEPLKNGTVAFWQSQFENALHICLGVAEEDLADPASTVSVTAKRAFATRVDAAPREYKTAIKPWWIDRIPPADTFTHSSLSEFLHDRRQCAHRNQVNVWYQSAPYDFRKSLAGRLVQEDQFSPAMAELFIYRLFCNEYWDVRAEPYVSGVRPDFLVRTEDDNFFYCEVTQMQPSRTLKGARESFGRLFARLDRLDSNFLLSVQLDRWDDTINSDAVAQLVMAWLQTLPNSSNAAEVLQISEHGFHGTIIARHRNGIDSERGCIYFWKHPRPHHSSIDARIFRSMQIKAKRDEKWICSERMPYVLALSTATEERVDDLQMIDDLYGGFDLQYHANSALLQLRLPMHVQSVFGPRRFRGFSALLWHSQRRAGERMRYEVTVFHNPWADFSLPRGLR